jgi:hypothetical protein
VKKFEVAGACNKNFMASFVFGNYQKYESILRLLSMPYGRQLDSVRMIEFNPMAIHMGIMVNKDSWAGFTQ